MSGSWQAGFLTGDVLTSTELGKSMGSFYDSTLGTIAASFDITTIPTWGTGLRINVQARGDTAATSVAVRMQLNGNSAAAYGSQYIRGNGSTSSAGESNAATVAELGSIAAASAGGQFAGNLDLLIPNFRSSTFVKSWQALASWSQSVSASGMTTETRSGAWNAASPITRVTIFPATGNFVGGSRCTAYVLGP